MSTNINLIHDCLLCLSLILQSSKLINWWCLFSQWDLWADLLGFVLFRNAVQADEEETNFRMRAYRVKLLNSQYTKSPNIPVLLLHDGYSIASHTRLLFFLANGSPPKKSRGTSVKLTQLWFYCCTISISMRLLLRRGEMPALADLWRPLLCLDILQALAWSITRANQRVSFPWRENSPSANL